MNYLLSFRGSHRGGPVVPGRLEAGPNLGTLESLQLESTITILLHGFNVNYKKGRYSLLEFARALPSASSRAVVATLWPGDHWLGPLNYSFEGRDADDSARELARFLGDVIRPTVSITFIGHSLGCRVAMETISHLVSTGHDPSQVCLMAAAIDDDSLAAPGDYLAATKRVTRVAALSSREDTVLKFAYPVGDLFQAFVFTDDTAGLALGYHGPRPDKKSSTPVPQNVLDTRIPKGREVGHSDYLPKEGKSSQKHRAAVRSAANFADAIITGADRPDYV
jgi:pimeloyl-ACP methyl ester carboxylesterase